MRLGSTHLPGWLFVLFGISACEGAPDSGGATSESALVQIDEPRLAAASRGQLLPDGTVIGGTDRFATVRFWANVGETFHLHVKGPNHFDVYRVLSGGNHDRSADVDYGRDHAKAFPVASGSGDLDLAVTRTGYHVISVGSPEAATSITYEISASVTRRPETTGIVSMSQANYRGCAVTTEGALECWGWTNGYDPTNRRSPQAPPIEKRVGATLASMGANVPTIKLPGAAAQVSLATWGSYTAPAVRLEDGRIYAWFEGGEPTRIALDAPATHIEGGTCARLTTGAVQCWRIDPSSNAATVTSPVTWPGRSIRSFTATDKVLCVVFDDETYTCTRSRAPSVTSPVALDLAPGEHVVGITADTFERCAITNRSVRCSYSNRWDDPAAPFTEIRTAALPPGEVIQALDVDTISVVMKDGTAWRLATGAWVPEPGFSSSIKSVSRNHTMGNVSTCALLEGGRVKCAGSMNAGHLGVGDLVDRDPTKTDAMGDNLPALDLGP